MKRHDRVIVGLALTKPREEAAGITLVTLQAKLAGKVVGSAYDALVLLERRFGFASRAESLDFRNGNRLAPRLELPIDAKADTMQRVEVRYSQ